MKTDTGHPDMCAHKSHTYHEECSQGRVWTTHRCIHWQQDTYMQTRGTGVQKCGDIQRKTGRTRRLHRDSRNGYTEGHVERCKGRHVCTATLTDGDAQMVVHE